MTKWLVPVSVALMGVAILVEGCGRPTPDTAFVSDESLRETAHILVHFPEWGLPADQIADRYGDAILPLIEKETAGYSDFFGMGPYYIADVLGAIRTPRSHNVLTDLYSRSNAIARSIGAVGLAQQGNLPDHVNESSFLVQDVRNDSDQTVTQLSIIALGWTHDEKAVPCLIDLLQRRPLDYWHHAYACEAIARIASRKAVPVLRDCLQSEQFFALAEAFRTLIALGDREAVPLAIARVTSDIKDLNSGFVVTELERVTGKSYGYDQVHWQQWWDSAKANWTIPSEFTQPWDVQPELYSLNTQQSASR